MLLEYTTRDHDNQAANAKALRVVDEDTYAKVMLGLSLNLCVPKIIEIHRPAEKCCTVLHNNHDL